MRGAVLPTIAALAAALLGISAFAGEAEKPRESFGVALSDGSPGQGEPVLVEVSADPPLDNAVFLWKGREFTLKPAGPGRLLGLAGVDLLEPPGRLPLSVRGSRGGLVLRFETEVAVRKTAFPVQEMTLPESMAVFDNATLDRIRREAERLDNVLAVVSPPSWEAPFCPPVKDFRPKGFGSRRVINGEPRAPHAGVDVHLPEGTPVAAVAAGTVAFAGEQFFGGRSVVIDHGGGVFSIYYHLRDYRVSEGARVSRCETIGAVGSTGRSTGPHLHFGMRAAGGRVDPTRLFDPGFH